MAKSLVAFLGLAAVSGACVALDVPASSGCLGAVSAVECPAVSAFVRDWFHGSAVVPGKYIIAFVDLSRHGGREALVYLTGQEWCGSGGCTLLVLAPDGPSYRVVTKVTICWPPIRALESRSFGWRDIGVGVRGGGVPRGEAELRFDGRSYPTNPSTLPAARSARAPAGRTIIGWDEAFRPQASPSAAK